MDPSNQQTVVGASFLHHVSHVRLAPPKDVADPVVILCRANHETADLFNLDTKEFAKQ